MATTQTENAKESGVEWIGNIPSHWEVKKVAWSFRTMGSGTTPTSSVDAYFDGDIPWVNTGDLNDGFVTEATKTVSAQALQEFSALRYYPEGTLLIALYGATIGKLGILTRPSTVNQACFAMGDANGVDSKFAFYWFLGSRRHIIAMAYGGGQPNISGEIIKQLRLTLPPLSEQRAIAAFLDRKTAQIDAVVAKKQRLIERLQEKRQALISHAVTKGLDPHAPMKDSGIEWLGKIPRHWTAERLKFSITKIEQGWSPQCDNRQAEDGEWGVLKVGCVNRSEFDSNEQKALPEELAPVAQYEIGEGDILMSRGNTRELVGSAALVKAVRSKLLLCDLLYRFRSRPQKADSQFLVLQLRSPVVRYQIEREATGTSASMKKIGQETIRSFWIVLPPIEEQQRIIVHIAEQAEYIDKMTDRIRTQICKLQEYRQTLISAAVTGKIDVTQEAAC